MLVDCMCYKMKKKKKPRTDLQFGQLLRINPAQCDDCVLGAIFVGHKCVAYSQILASPIMTQ